MNLILCVTQLQGNEKKKRGWFGYTSEIKMHSKKTKVWKDLAPRTAEEEKQI